MKSSFGFPPPARTTPRTLKSHMTTFEAIETAIACIQIQTQCTIIKVTLRINAIASSIFEGAMWNGSFLVTQEKVVHGEQATRQTNLNAF